MGWENLKLSARRIDDDWLKKKLNFDGKKVKVKRYLKTNISENLRKVDKIEENIFHGTHARLKVVQIMTASHLRAACQLSGQLASCDSRQQPLRDEQNLKSHLSATPPHTKTQVNSTQIWGFQRSALKTPNISSSIVSLSMKKSSKFKGLQTNSPLHLSGGNLSTLEIQKSSGSLTSRKGERVALLKTLRSQVSHGFGVLDTDAPRLQCHLCH